MKTRTDYTAAIQALRLDDRTTEFLKQLSEYLDTIVLEREEDLEPLSRH